MTSQTTAETGTNTCHENFFLKASPMPTWGKVLADLIRRYPEFGLFKQIIEHEALKNDYDLKVVVVHDTERLGFMTAKPGPLHGALLVKQAKLVRCISREELGLEFNDGSSAAIEDSLQYHVSDS